MPNVEDVLRDWQEWDIGWPDRPSVERELPGGHTNQSFLISADEQLWVLRLNGQHSNTLGIDRTREAAIVEHAAAAGIAPAIAYCSPERGLLVTEFIDGRHWHADTLVDPERLACLLDLVKRVHMLKVDLAPIDYFVHAEFYWTRITEGQRGIPDSLRRERDLMLKHCELKCARNTHTQICHHDLNPANIIDQNGRLYLLDWEYAACGSPAFDYAAISTEWGVPIERLHGYVGIDSATLNDAARLYQYICRLWALLNEGSNNDQSRD